MSQFPEETSCACYKCRSMCRVPCLPTPKEAIKLIDCGLSNYLMWRTIFVESVGIDIDLLCPATKGDESNKCSHNWTSCIFQTKAGLCQLHDKSLKPLEGRVTDCRTSNKKGQYIHDQIALMWNSDEGRKIVSEWKEKHSII